MRIYLDLDGPVLDVSERYWRIHVDVLRSLGKPWLTQADYWEAKREKTPIAEILSRAGSRAVEKEYTSKRLKLLESPQYLRYDTIRPEVGAFLSGTKAHELPVLVTLRNSRESLMWQLQQLRLIDCFSAILTTNKQKTPRWTLKRELIESFRGEFEEKAILVGDTETDILAGKSLGYKTVGVTFGIRSEVTLQNSDPDVLCRTAVEMVGYISAHGSVPSET